MRAISDVLEAADRAATLETGDFWVKDESGNKGTTGWGS